MSGGGYGRGGRGAALLQALNVPIRKPGEPPQVAQQTAAPQVAQQPVAPQVAQQTAAPKPTGRGFALQQMLHALPPQTPATRNVPPAEPHPPVLPPQQMVAAKPIAPSVVVPGGALGRASALQNLLKQPSGRGALLASLPSSSPVGPLSPHSSQSSITPEDAEQKAGGTLGRASALQNLLKQPSGRGALSPVPSSTPTPPSPHSPQSNVTQELVDGERKSKLAYMLERISTEKETVHKGGQAGQKIPLVANYIPVKCTNEGQFQYAVSFSPEVHSKNMRFKLLYSQTDVIGTTRNFDGAILFLPMRLPQEITYINSERPTDQEPVKITIKLVKVLPPEQCIQLYNVLFRNIMRILKYVEVNHHNYDPHRPAKIPQHRLEVWPGYVTALSRYEGGLMLMADVSHKVLRTETAYEVICDLQQKSGGGRFKDEVMKSLLGSVIMTRYNNKTYRVDDIMWDMNPNSSFELSSGQKLTFKEYYFQHYKKEIRDLQQPLLVNKPKKREVREGRQETEIILLVPELCYMTGLSDAMRTNIRVKKDLAMHTRIAPSQRHLAMRQYCENINSHPEARQELAKWGLELDMDCLNLAGRKLSDEMLVFGKNQTSSAGPKAKWQRNATAHDGMLNAVPLHHWMVICTQRNSNTVTDMLQMLCRSAKSMGMPITEPQVFPLRSDRTEDYVRTTRDNLSEQMQLVMFVMPTRRDDRYNGVKKLVCCECPIPSQVVNIQTISMKDKLRSVCQNLVLQMNCKLGGSLWRMRIPAEINSRQAGGLMVVGIDVYHDKGRNQSVAAIVCNSDVHITRFYSEVVFQERGQELIDKLKVAFTAAIRKYHSVNHMLPSSYVVFRDGVGDGQLRVVAEHESTQMMSAFSSFGKDYEPKFAEIVVQKRINTRMFLKKGDGRNASLDNPLPGSILDHSVTRRDWYDFFLISQYVTQGTVTPSHYVVVCDHTGWSADIMQKLSYQMCHMYYNWPGTIRVPAPCQYAHTLAKLSGLNLHKKPNEILNDRLFYL